ncbi:hypothetical protein MUK42_29719 [Musa troglodytarum]|uniref:Uncharacterized protein n=1 Tax=Musa troglodytarum TaxID=320322 RepID=A0A9E7HL33_9LILI|nr:hypothetical protein MUK42_29719 [Musa troglodytarum]
MAMLLTMVVSIFLFSFKPTLQLFLGIIICMISLHMLCSCSHVVDLQVKAASDTLKEIAVEPTGES